MTEAEATGVATADAGKRARRGWLSYAIRLAISTSVLLLVIRSISWAEILRVLSAADIRYVMAGTLGVIPVVLLKGIKWWLLLRNAGIPATIHRTALSYMVGMGFGLVTPGRVGELARIWVLDLRKEDYVTAGTLVLVDRLTDLYSLLCLASLSVYRFFGIRLFAAYVGTGLLGSFVVFCLLRSRWAVAGRLTKHPGFVSRVLAALVAVQLRQFVIYSLFGLAVTFCGVAMVHLYLNALVRVSFWDCVVALPVVFMNNILPVTIGGVGVREVIMTFVFKGLGVDAPVAVSAILVYFTASMVFPGVVGLAWAGATRTHRH